MTARNDGGVYVRKADEWDVEGWTSVPNRMARDRTLPWDCKGAYAWLASHSRDYRISTDDLAADGDKGREHARGMVRRLEADGWLTRTKVTDRATGRILFHDWQLQPRPVPVEQRTTPAPHPSKGSRRPDAVPPRRRAGDPETGPLGTGDDLGKQDRAADLQIPTSRPETGALVSGSPETGPPVTGPPVSLEKTTENTRKNPPTPAPRGSDHDHPAEPPACPTHGASCRLRACGTAPRQVAAANARDQRSTDHADRTAAQLAAREARAERRAGAAEAGAEAREAIRAALRERHTTPVGS